MFTIRMGGQFISELPVKSEFEKVKPEAVVEVTFEEEPTDEEIQAVRERLEKVLEQATSALLTGYADTQDFFEGK